MAVTVADIVTVVAIAAIVDAGMVAASLSVVVVAVVSVEMMETESGACRFNFCRGTTVFLIPPPTSCSSPEVSHCP